jgi:hypothetical protein
MGQDRRLSSLWGWAVPVDDAASGEIYSAFFPEKEWALSSFRSLREGRDEGTLQVPPRPAEVCAPGTRRQDSADAEVSRVAARMVDTQFKLPDGSAGRVPY